MQILPPSLTFFMAAMLPAAFVVSLAGLLVISLRRKKSQPVLLPLLFYVPLTTAYASLPGLAAAFAYGLFGWLGEPYAGYLFLAAITFTALIPIGYAVIRKQWGMAITLLAACLSAYLLWTLLIGGMDGDTAD